MTTCTSSSSPPAVPSSVSSTFPGSHRPSSICPTPAAPGCIAAQLETWLLRSKDPFPYFLLVALEAGSLLRAIALLLAYPFAWLLHACAPTDGAAVKLLVFISCAGLRLNDIEGVGRAVLPRFFAEDVRARAWKVFSAFPSCRRHLVSAFPRPMIEPFARNQLGAQQLVASDLHVTASGRCLGFLKTCSSGVGSSTDFLPQLFTSCLTVPSQYKHISDLRFMSSTLKQESDEDAASMADLQNPVVFHDGRLVLRPTPAVALMVFLWMPVGFVLALVRVLICSRAPYCCWAAVARLSGVRFVVKGKLPARSDTGLLLVSNHRTLLDPIFIAMGLGRPVTAVTYSVSRLSEILSPISTARLQRDAEKDLRMLKELISKGRNVVLCPEGTTSREPLLLRFSALFGEVTDDINPVAVKTRAEFFHGTTARGWKAMDSFFFLMNPSPCYEVAFLEKLPAEMTCGAGRQSRYDVANYVQQLMAAALDFQCSSFTRPHKYRILAGTDGSVSVTS